MELWELYLIFCKIGAVTFGGGYAMLPLFQNELVTRSGLISPADFANMAALAQLTPGAIGLNMATYIGYHHAGFLGAGITTGGLLTPPLFIVTAIAYFFIHFADNRWIQKIIAGIRPVMIGLIAAAAVFFLQISVIDAQQRSLDWRGLVIFAVALLAAGRLHLNVPLVIIITAILGAVLNLL